MRKRFKKINLLVLLFVVFAGGLAVYYINEKGFTLNLRSRASQTNWPITGTFFGFPTNQSERFYRGEYQDMKEIGMKTLIVIIPVKTTCTLNATGDAYRFSFSADGVYNGFLNKMVAARKEGMEIFLGDSFFGDIANLGEFTNYCGNPEKFAQTEINFWKELRNKIGADYFDNLKFGGNNFIQGFYLRETDLNGLMPSPHLTYFKLVSQKVKAEFPGKLMMISPYPDRTYEGCKASTISLFSQTKVDILAPQDGVGACLSGLNESREHFRGYRDGALNFPGRQVWANVESFEFKATINRQTGKTKCGASGVAFPTSINRLQQQIEAVKPYVSKIITWTYTNMSSYSLLANPARLKLRADYEQYYGQAQPVLIPTSFPAPIRKIIGKWRGEKDGARGNQGN